MVPGLVCAVNPLTAKASATTAALAPVSTLQLRLAVWHDKRLLQRPKIGSYNHSSAVHRRQHYKKGTKLHFKSPTVERRHASCVGGWRGSNPRRPAPMEQGMPALTSWLLLALHRICDRNDIDLFTYPFVKLQML